MTLSGILETECRRLSTMRTELRAPLRRERPGNSFWPSIRPGRFVAAPFSALMALWRTLIVEPSVTSVVASANPAGLNERHVLPHACCPCAVYALPGSKPSRQFPPWDARIQPIRHCATPACSLPDVHLAILPAQAVAGVPPCTCRAFFRLCHASARLYAMGVPSLLNRGSFSR